MKPLLIVCFSLTGFVANAQFQTPGSKFKFNSDFTNRKNLTHFLTGMPL